MQKIKLTMITLALTIFSAVSSFAADTSFSYSKVINLELFDTLSETTKGNFAKNMANMPNSMMDLQKRLGGTVYFTTDLIPDYTDNAASTFGEDTMGVCYTGGQHNNDIYIRINKDLDDNCKYNQYWRTVTHEFGHFAYFNTYDQWTYDMKNALTVEFNNVKDTDKKCYNENETFAHEYSKYVESETLVSPEMAALFKKVESMVVQMDQKFTHAYNIDEPRQENIVTFELTEIEQQMVDLLNNEELFLLLTHNNNKQQ